MVTFGIIYSLVNKKLGNYLKTNDIQLSILLWFSVKYFVLFCACGYLLLLSHFI